MIQLIRANLGLQIVIALMLGALLVCALLAAIMSRGGASLRPLFWFFGFFSLIVLPQFFGHLYKATRSAAHEAPKAEAHGALATSTNANQRSSGAITLFGPDVDPRMIVDVRNAHGGVFANAESAQFAVLPNSESVLLARFGGYVAAEKAWVAYLRESGLSQLKGEGDSQRGYWVTRPAGDRACVLHMDNMVGIWTGKDDEAIRTRMAAGGFEISPRAPLQPSAAATVPASNKKRVSVPLIIGGMAVYLFIVVIYFFKGAAWAGSKAPNRGVVPASVTDLASRLESINTIESPFHIERGKRPNEFIATWRYADAKWIDLARARGMRRTFQVRIVLDERNRTARATDYAASYDWSVGRGGADIQWQGMLGIVFFQSQHERVFGLRLDEGGRFKPELSYAYSFNLSEMKSPLMEAVIASGWTWRPTIWHGPKWLRWLTE